MKYTYTDKRDSPGKCAARALLYSRIPKEDLWSKLHLTNGGRECGDVKLLVETFNVPAHNIIVADPDSVSRAAVRKYNVYASPCHTLEEAVQLYDLADIASINIDLTYSLVNGFPILAEVCKHIPRGWKGNLFYTFERAFDKKFHLHGTKERIEFLCNHLNAAVNWRLNPDTVLRDGFKYHSYTQKGCGSPMMLVHLWKHTGKTKRKE